MRYGMIALIGGLSVCGLSAVPAQAESGFKFDTRELYQDCRAAQGSADYSYCLGVVTGVGYMMLMVNGARTQMRDGDDTAYLAPLGLCTASSPPSFEELVQAFVTWAEGHAEEGDLPAGIGVQKALSEAWPCR